MLDYPEKPHQQESDQINLSDDSDDNEEKSDYDESPQINLRNSNQSQGQHNPNLGAITEESTSKQVTTNSNYNYTPNKVFYSKQSAKYLLSYQRKKNGSEHK